MAGIAGCCPVARPAQRGAGIRLPWAPVPQSSSRWRLHGRTTGGWVCAPGPRTDPGRSRSLFDAGGERRPGRQQGFGTFG